VGSAGTDSACESFETLSDGYDQRAADWRTVNPLALGILCLESAVRAGLEQIGGEH
jgi:hypothetical protein